MPESTRPQRRFLIDETAVETRLAQLIHGRLVFLKLYPHVAPGLDRAQVGDVYLVRVLKAARGMAGCFVDLGPAGEGLLRAKAPPPEGAFVLAKVTRSAYGSKLPGLALAGTPEAGVERRPRRLAPGPSAVKLSFELASPGDQILVDGNGAFREAQSEVRSRASEIELKSAPIGLFEREGVEAMLESALEPIVPLSGGGRLILEETEAVVAIDVDVAGAPRAADVNLSAAAEIPYQIAARRLGGTMVVDFAQVRRAAELAPLKARLKSSAEEIGLDLEIGFAGRTGLLELNRARSEAPLAAALTQAGVTHSSVPVVLRAEAQTARLARAVRATSARMAGALMVRVSSTLGEWLTRGDGYPAWQAMVQSSAAPLQLKADKNLNTEAFEVERNEKGAA